MAAELEHHITQLDEEQIFDKNKTNHSCRCAVGKATGMKDDGKNRYNSSLSRMTDSQGIISPSGGREDGEGNDNTNVSNGTFAAGCGEEDSAAHSDAENRSQGKIIFGPLSKEESERLQREANEETTKSEDLRLFLQYMICCNEVEVAAGSARSCVRQGEDQEMHQHMQQQQQQQQQLHQVGSSSQMFGSSGIPHHQFQHQTSTRSHVLQQTSTLANTQKRSVTGPEQGQFLNLAFIHLQTLTTIQCSFSLSCLPDNVIDSSPDGGWGWIVVFSSFVCMILVEGICLSYGLLVAPICPGNSLQAVEVTTPLLSRSRLLTATSLGIVWSSKARTVPLRPGTCVGVSEMGEALDTQSRMALMAPGGLLVGIYLLLGPLASALSNQFDFRPVAMAGGAIATVGLLSAAFSRNVAMLNATLGGIGGIGFGLIYLPAIATVGHWFKRRRPFAVGLALCGSGVGSIVGGQVFPFLVQWFSWSGTLIVLAAFCMQCLVSEPYSH
ncbi:Monocarboxylate transporter 12 [Taenia solium]|eukprot:TsM_001117600 transcript=TsM_001117600 gene=TsM_001117600